MVGVRTKHLQSRRDGDLLWDAAPHVVVVLSSSLPSARRKADGEM